MQNGTLRTIGATIVLAVVAVWGIAQANADRDTTEPEIATVESTTSTSPQMSTTLPPPFVYRVGVLAGVTTDNFWAFYDDEPSVWNSYILGPTKPALFTADAVGSLEPEVAATNVEPARVDGRWSVTVDLDPGYEWSDGTPLTAHDLVFTFHTVRSLDLGGSWSTAFPEEVAAIRAEDDQSVRIDFSERPELSVWPHGVGLAPIMPRHAWAGTVGAANRQDLYEADGGVDVGGGPLAIESVSDHLIVSTANPGYPNSEVADTVEYHVLETEAEATTALTEGEIDTILTPKGLTAESVKSLQGERTIEILANPGNGVRYLAFNLDREPMADREFRTALALLLERETLAETIPNTGPVARSLVPSANRSWFDQESADANTRLYDGPIAERLDTALEGLRSVGYEWETVPSIEDEELLGGDGLTIDGRAPQPLTILTPGDEYDPARPEYASQIAGILGILGFDARPVVTDFDTVVDLAFTPDETGALHYDMYLLGWTLGNPALPDYYAALFSSDGPLNNTGYDSQEFSEALESYETAIDRESAFEALWEMEGILAADLPYLLLYSNQIMEAYRSDRVSFEFGDGLGGIQATLGGIRDMSPVG